MRVASALVLWLLLLAPGRGFAEVDPSILADRIETLTAPELAGRGNGTPEIRVAADSLAQWLRDLGLRPAFGESWFQEFRLKGEGWTGEDLTGQTALNVAGLLEGSGDLRDEFVLLSAHYDHLGRVNGGRDSADAALPEPGEYYPGANDNASGVAAVLEAVRQFNEEPASCRGVLVVFFAAEEVGLQGSAHFVNSPPCSLGQIKAMINLDTVGQLLDGRLLVSGIGTTRIFPDVVERANSGRMNLSLARSGWSGSDHMTFNTREIPVLFLFGGPYQQYNRPTDTLDSLDLSALADVATYTSALVDLVRTVDDSLSWVMVADKALRDDGDPGNRQTWFGSMPDFTEEIHGYRLAGVFDNSPAARAGLQKGDVLVALGGTPVTDLATFTRALRQNDPGDLVEVVVLRENQRLNFTVVLGDRSQRE